MCTQTSRRLGKRCCPDSCPHVPAWSTLLHPLTSTYNAQLLNVWVEPLVHVNVRLVEGSTAADSAVIIEATNWSLHGSELIESLGLNRRFSLAFQVNARRHRIASLTAMKDSHELCIWLHTAGPCSAVARPVSPGRPQTPPWGQRPTAATAVLRFNSQPKVQT